MLSSRGLTEFGLRLTATANTIRYLESMRTARQFAVGGMTMPTPAPAPVPAGGDNSQMIDMMRQMIVAFNQSQNKKVYLVLTDVEDGLNELDGIRVQSRIG